MIRSYFLVFSTFISCLAENPPTYGLLGQAVSFNPGIQTPPEDILWKHNGNKVVEFDGMVQTVYGSYEGRITLDWHAAEIEISDLRYEDRGKYTLEVFHKTMVTYTYELQVIGKVSKPTITCEVNTNGSSDGSGKTATLTCSAESRQSQLLKFDWSSHGKQLQPGLHNPNLTITLGDEQDHEMYNCSVSNPLTTESAVFIAKDCYTETSISTGLVVGLCIFFLILLLVGGVAWMVWRGGYCERRNKKDVENLDSNSVPKGSENNGEDCRLLLDRAPTMPSHQRLWQPFLRNNGELETKDASEEKGDQENITPSHAVPPKPRRSGILRNDREHADGDDPREATEEKVSENDPSESEKENEASPGQQNNNGSVEKRDQDNRTSFPPAVAPKPRHSIKPRNDREHADGDDPREATEEKVSENDPSESEKENEASPGQQNNNGSVEKRDQDNRNSFPPAVAPKPRHSIKPRNDREHADGDDPREATEEKVSENDPSESEKENEASPGQQNNNGSVEKRDQDNRTSFPPAVAPKPRHSIKLRNDREHADGDDPREATEEKVSENDPSESEKENEASPGQQNNNGSVEKRDQDNRTSFPPAVAPKPRHSIKLTNDREHADGDDPREATEEKVSENDPSESEKENEASPGQQNNNGSVEKRDQDNRTSFPPAVAPKPRHSIKLRNDREHADGDDPREATEEKVSENDPSESEKENEASPGQQNNNGSVEKRDQDNRTSFPPAVAPKPRHSIKLTNDREHADGDDPREATEEKVSENDPSESEKENEASPGQQNNNGSVEKRDQDNRTSFPPAVAPKPRHSIKLRNDREHADGDDPREATEEKVSENDPSESEKENEASPGQQNNNGSVEKRDQDNRTSFPPAVAPKPRHSIKPRNDREHADGDDPREATEEKVSQNDPSESEKENEASPGQQNNNESDYLENIIVNLNSLDIYNADEHQKNASSDEIAPEQEKEAGDEVRECQPSTLELKPAEMKAHDQNSMQPEVETYSREETLQKTDKNVSKDSNEPDDVDDQEEKKSSQYSSAVSQIVSKLDNSDNNTHLESPDVAGNAPDQEEKDKTRQSNHCDIRTEETDTSEAAEGTSSATQKKR